MLLRLAMSANYIANGALFPHMNEFSADAGTLITSASLVSLATARGFVFPVSEIVREASRTGKLEAGSALKLGWILSVALSVPYCALFYNMGVADHKIGFNFRVKL